MDKKGKKHPSMLSQITGPFGMDIMRIHCVELDLIKFLNCDKFDSGISGLIFSLLEGVFTFKFNLLKKRYRAKLGNLVFPKCDLVVQGYFTSS